MMCAWQDYLRLIPVWLRQKVDTLGKQTLLELRLRLGEQPEMVTLNGDIWVDGMVTMEDLKFTVNMASRYSPWAAKTSADGFITAPGGHRVGLCGSVVSNGDRSSGMHEITSLCIRVARNITGIAKNAVCAAGSVLIIGRPGSGKTTFLRDFVRTLSGVGMEMISVVDEREEIFPRANEKFCFSPGRKTDVISGCKKSQAIEMVLRNMTPTVIAVDEITAQEDCYALLHAGWCGTRLIATAHAGSKQDLYSRPVYRPIIEAQLFDSIIILHDDRSWHSERMGV